MFKRLSSLVFAPSTNSSAAALGRLAKSPSPSEDSLLFRVLVQALVSVGIVATDVAATTQMSLWAIPLSALGASWSWRQRQHSSVGLKFALAAALLAALAYFFQNLLGQLNDTRLVLAELLVQVQVIHTFDMPRRKDLGYSIVIGVILLAVAATLGQTMAFAPLLLAFMALALPVMVLDYRSRLGLAPAKLDWFRGTGGASSLPVKPLAKLLGVVLLLGLVLFAFLPRLPSYQLQSLPMSGEMPANDFNPQSIINPGYPRDRGGADRGGLSIDGPGSGEGEAFDPDNYYGFNSRINQNFRGQLQPRVVLRVRAQAPGFWRVLAFDRYDGQGWEISQNDNTKVIDRSPWSNKFNLPRPATTSRTRRIIQSYTAVADLPNVLPALSTPSEVYFPSRKMAIDREGSLRSAAGLVPNFTYTVVSEVPERDPGALALAGDRYEPQIRPALADYRQIDPSLAAKLRPFTEKIIAEYPERQISKDAPPLNNNYDTALYLAQYLKQTYTAPTAVQELPALAANRDLVEWFLWRCQDATAATCSAGGYPDHFATVHVMMLRSIGIPARLAVGFQPGQFNPFTGLYEVKNTDAHALTEVYFPRHGWVSFDPLPGHPLTPPTWEEAQTFSLLKQMWQWVAGWLPAPVMTWIGAIVGYVVGALAWMWAGMSQSWWGALLGLAVSLGLAFGLWYLFKQGQKWRYQRWLQRQPPMERLYLQMLAGLVDRSLPSRHPSQTPWEHWQQMEAHPDVQQTVQPIVAAYVAWRYGQQVPNLAAIQPLVARVRRRSPR